MSSPKTEKQFSRDGKLNWKIELRLCSFNLTGKWRFCHTHDFVFNEAYERSRIISFKSNIISTRSECALPGEIPKHQPSLNKARDQLFHFPFPPTMQIRYASNLREPENCNKNANGRNYVPVYISLSAFELSTLHLSTFHEAFSHFPPFSHFPANFQRNWKTSSLLSVRIPWPFFL